MAKKYLIIQTAFIGDVILATPVIESLKKHNLKYKLMSLLKKRTAQFWMATKALTRYLL